MARTAQAGAPAAREGRWFAGAAPSAALSFRSAADLDPFRRPEFPMTPLEITVAIAATVWGCSTLLVGGAYVGCRYSERIRVGVLG